MGGPVILIYNSGSTAQYYPLVSGFYPSNASYLSDSRGRFWSKMTQGKREGVLVLSDVLGEADYFYPTSYTCKYHTIPRTYADLEYADPATLKK